MARKLTNSEIKVEEMVTRIRGISQDVADDLKNGNTVPTQLLIDVIETQNNVLDTLLRGFLESRS